MKENDIKAKNNYKRTVHDTEKLREHMKRTKSELFAESFATKSTLNPPENI